MILLSVCTFLCAAGADISAIDVNLRLKLTHDLTRDVSSNFDAKDFSKYAPLALLEQKPADEGFELRVYYAGKNDVDEFRITFWSAQTSSKALWRSYEITYQNTENSTHCVTVSDVVPYAQSNQWAAKTQWSDSVEFHIRMEREDVEMRVSGFANLPFPEPGGAPAERISPDTDMSDYCVSTLSFSY